MACTDPTSNVTTSRLLYEASLEEMAPEMEKLEASELLAVNVDIPSAVTTVLGSLSKLTPFRSEIAKYLPHFDLKAFDHIERNAMGLSFAHSLCIGCQEADDELPATLARAAELRDLLVGDATTLARRGLIDGQFLRNLKGPVGYKHLASDLQVISSVLHANWAPIENNCAVKLDELHEADRLADKILRTLGRRAHGRANAEAAAEIRARAFTLFANAYNDVRHAIAYLRLKQGDADSIAPSFYPANRGRRRKAKEEEAPNVAGVDQAATVPMGVPAYPQAPSTQVAPTAHDAGAVATTPPTFGRGTGFPGGDPFMN